MCNLFSKIPAKTHFLCLQALLNVEVIEIQRYAKMSGENSEKKSGIVYFFLNNFGFYGFRIIANDQKGCKTMASNENPKGISCSPHTRHLKLRN